MLLPAPSMSADYASLHRDFVWAIPADFNIAALCCDVWAQREPERPAILDATGGGLLVTSFGALKQRSDALAAALAARGFVRGDRFAILLPQSADVAVAHPALRGDVQQPHERQRERGAEHHRPDAPRLVAVQRLVHGLHAGNAVGREAAAAQAFKIHGARSSWLALAHHKRR